MPSWQWRLTRILAPWAAREIRRLRVQAGHEARVLRSAQEEHPELVRIMLRAAATPRPVLREVQP